MLHRNIRRSDRELIKYCFRALGWGKLLVYLLSTFSLSYIEMTFALTLQALFVKTNLLSMSSDTSQILNWIISNIPLLWIGVLVIVISIMKVSSRLISAFTGIWLDNLTQYHIRVHILYLLLVSPERQLYESAAIQHRFNTLTERAGSLCYTGLRLLSSSIQCAFLYSILVYMMPTETLIVTVALLIAAYFLTIINRQIKRFAKRVLGQRGALSEYIQRLVKTMAFIHVSYTHFQEYFQGTQRSKQIYKQSLKLKLFNQGSAFIPELIGVSIIMLILCINHLSPQASSGLLVPYFYLFYRLIQNLIISTVALANLNSNLPYFQELFETYLPYNILSALPVVSDPKPTDTESSELSQSPSISIKDLSFHWEESSPIFDSFSWDFSSGKIHGIIGESGCGKSTLLDLILGLCEPDSGTVEINGLAPKDFIQKYHQSIGMVEVTPSLIKGSIRENLIYGSSRRDVGDEELWDVLEKVQLKADIFAKEEQLDFAITETEDGLSAGQKQRLSIARALLKHPALLILDEPSANLDTAVENKLLETLEALRGHATVIIVSHRKKLLEICDTTLSLPLEADS